MQTHVHIHVHVHVLVPVHAHVHVFLLLLLLQLLLLQVLAASAVALFAAIAAAAAEEDAPRWKIIVDGSIPIRRFPDDDSEELRRVGKGETVHDWAQNERLEMLELVDKLGYIRMAHLQTGKPLLERCEKEALAASCLLPAACCSLPAGYWLLAASCYFLLVVCFLLLPARC